MIGVNIQGRFGNQLFQYFFIRGLEKKLKVSFFINDSFEDFQLENYFILKDYKSRTNYFKLVFCKLNLRFNTKKYSRIEESEMLLNPKQNLNNKLYSGYFQSEIFFAQSEKNAKDWINIKSEFSVNFSRKYSNLFDGTKKNIAVHVRRGDYEELGLWWKKNLGSEDLTLPVSYYINTLNAIPELYKYNILFISDEIEFVKKEFSMFDNAKFIGDSLINDFQILLKSDILILSNSSFSWWGAYLNVQIDKQIFCPKYWLGFRIRQEYPKNIILNTWNQIDVDSKLGV